MFRHPALVFACLVLPAACGCGGARSAATSDSPSIELFEPGQVEVRVLGAPGEVRFFVNGEGVGAADEWSSWKDAQVVLELPSGVHTVEARFPIGRFEGQRLESTVTTLEPIQVEPGERLRLEADLRRQWSADLPEERIHYFRISGGGYTPSSFDLPQGDPAWHSTLLVPDDSTMPSVAPGDAVPDGESIPLVLEPPGGPLAPQQITVRGREVVSGARRAPAGKATAVGTRTPASGSSFDSGAVEVTLLVETQPAGAHASLGDRYLGRTPVRVRLDPRVDHVVQVEREGCDPKVQWIGSAEWRQGRSPKVMLRLDCP